MPTDAMSLEDIKIQREAMQKKIGDTEKKLQDSLKEREGFEALILSMERVAEWKEKQKQQLAEKVKEDKARLEEEICQLKLAVQGLSLAQEDCGSISDAQENCDSISDASRATSKVTLFSTIHSRERMADPGRDMPRREVQHVVKHGGEGVLQENGNRKVSLEGKNVILDRDEPRVVTVFRDGPAVQGPAEPQEQEFQVVKHSKQRTHKGPQMAGFSHESIPLKEDIEWFKDENTSLDAEARRRLDCLRGLEARISQEDLHKLIAPIASGRKGRREVATRVWNLLESIAEQWTADEVDEYIRAHGLRDDPANMLRGLPEDKKVETMHTTFFFDVRCKSNYLFKKLSV